VSCCVEFYHDGGVGAAVAGELDLVERTWWRAARPGVQGFGVGAALTLGW
jgi:hypothetical protein